MANIENLTQMGKPLTTERAQRIGAKGGKASGEARRKKKAMREAMENILMSKATTEKELEKLHEYGLSETDRQTVLLTAMYEQAMQGNVKAFDSIRDITGEKVQEIKVNVPIDEKVKELEEILDVI